MVTRRKFSREFKLEAATPDVPAAALLQRMRDGVLAILGLPAIKE